MPVWLECANCGDEHSVPERAADPETGGTQCPECGGKSYVVRRTGLAWHPDP
ncbi:hypothetical protein [Natrinema versiforme]|uniref:Uncharacterized protein n=1 Tax=Natrinema versiforme JCM 10478 TaxID=1227496 RepID=L9XXP4_9EURY|nr:hypothetical protein [Natrinema versiforme]ELY66530.1 hypothetical protein C489_12824 [Natrinema versiforme JCM 10478]